ncbi:APC family permease [Mycolicibacterium brisbanense]|uniref:Amino acid permease-associated region n=1 Tax=Mycolicibacterium brisbanense TaxID=146020 RepID=A0A100VZH9_9MYCO|nr:APC family permease [Mycolicibacterium brisbanense]MCV7159000.1 APC family permease [Mycolicibacterium brisbanense]GAS88854.1 amino acid permease-associated region, precursor [Mycolicibacterium brisbanense]
MSHQPTERTTTLERGALGRFNVLSLALSGVSPTTSVFLLYGTALGLAGTGVIWSFLLAGVIAVCIAACFAELGSIHHGSGGAYTIVRGVLGPVAGGVTNMLFLVSGLVVPALVLVAAATFLHELVPALPVNLTALAMLAMIIMLSLGRIAAASWVAATLLALEILVVLVFTVFCLTHTSPDIPNPLTHPVIAAGDHVGPVAVSAILLAVGPALFGYNGFDTPLYFDEEARHSHKASAQAVLVAVGLGVGIQLVAVVAATFAIPDLREVAGTDVPLAVIAEHTMGPVGAKIMIVGVIVAMFAAALAVTLVYPRIIFAAARDGMWPGPLNAVFGRLSANQVPVYSILVCGVGNAVLCAFTSLTSLASFGGLLVMGLYVLIAVSALVSRVRDRHDERPLKMLWWPLPPLIALVGVLLAVKNQAPRDLAIVAGVLVVSTVAYAAARRNLKPRIPSKGAAHDCDPTDSGAVTA